MKIALVTKCVDPTQQNRLLKGFDLCAFACASNPPLEKLSLFPFQL
jgi:hypothetical protein